MEPTPRQRATAELNYLLELRGLTKRLAAEQIGEPPAVVTHTVCFLRENKRVREKLAALLERPEEELFPPEIECMPARFRDRAA